MAVPLLLMRDITSLRFAFVNTSGMAFWGRETLLANRD